MLTLGIDPGVATTGFGLVRQLGDKLIHVDCGCIITTPKDSSQQRLAKIYAEMKKLIQLHKPQSIAVERLYFGENSKTAMARGIVMLAAAEAKVHLSEYTPLEVKMAITGYGKADKKQIQQMIKLLLKLPEVPKPDDAADALAIAITHLHSYRINRMGERVRV